MHKVDYKDSPQIIALKQRLQNIIKKQLSLKNYVLLISKLLPYYLVSFNAKIAYPKEFSKGYKICSRLKNSLIVCCRFCIIKSKKNKTKNQFPIQMNSLDKLLTNTTNRFQGSQSIILPQFQSNFTPIQNPQHDLQLTQSKNQSLIRQIAEINVPQTYEQLLQREKELMKILQQGKKEKQLMSALFEKIYLVEEGKEERMKKRFRRKKDEIRGDYSCEYCDKVYSSSTSLARHGKLKHPNWMMQPPQRDYQIPPQPNSTNQLNHQQRVESKDLGINGKKRRKLRLDNSQEGDFESLEAIDSSHGDVMLSEELS